jgi:hypothetical protein
MMAFNIDKGFWILIIDIRASLPAGWFIKKNLTIAYGH